MRGLAVVSALGLLALAGAAVDSPARTGCHPAGRGPPTERIHSANLDRDAHLERVIQTVGGCPHQSVLALEDLCGRATRIHGVPGLGVLARLDVVEANGREDGQELLFGFRPRKPTAGYRGNAGLVHFARVAVGACPRPVYVLSHFLRPPPRGAGSLTRFQLLRSAPREVRLHELFRGGRLRETRFRYIPGEDRYVVYRVTVTRA
jgi:hypothetical protein